MAEGKNAAVRRSANNKIFYLCFDQRDFAFAAAAGALYFVLRPQYLRIAVGPAAVMM